MNIYCFSTLSFAKLQFKSVINKAFHKHGVASFTDAWIETILSKMTEKVLMSHLLQMRGLKLLLNRVIYPNCVSHLLQMRGLKPATGASIVGYYMSHLLQMRGLKRDKLTILAKYYVASFTDAWIETVTVTIKADALRVASFTDAWIETVFCDEESIVMGSHLLQMRGLKLIIPFQSNLTFSRIFYRCVD